MLLSQRAYVIQKAYQKLQKVIDDNYEEIPDSIRDELEYICSQLEIAIDE
jgi:hypothetical protein